MPMIANYYAQVGIQIDPSGAAKITRYLNGIKRQMASFQSQLAKTSEVNLRVNIDTKKSMVGLNRSLRALSSGAFLTVRNVNFSKSELLKSLNKTISGSHGRTNLRIGALLSQESLNGMRAQLRASINSLVVSPTIRPNVVPRVRRGSAAGTVEGGGYSRRSMGGLSPFSKRGMNPWYNPMMVGGGVGAFLRYGVYSLPFVAGAMGLNALSNAGERIQNAYMAVRAQVGDPALAAQQLSFLEALGHNHGIRVADMAPGYSQMFAASQGTVLQNYIPKGFQNFIQYGSVIGMNEEQKKGAILALSQIVGKGGKGFAQELNLQLTNQGMPNARRLFAEAVAGGDMGKFEEMMQKGEVGLEGVMKFLNLLGEKAAPFLPQYYSTITAQKGRVGYATEQYTKEFMDAGGSRAIAGFYSTLRQVIADATPYAKDIAEYFEMAARAARVLLLVPGEVKDWFSGVDNDKNFLQMILGKPSESEFLESLRGTFASLTNIIKSSMAESSKAVQGLQEEFSFLDDFIAPLVRDIGSILELASAYQSGGVTALVSKNKEIENRGKAREQAEQEAKDIFIRTGKRVSRASIRKREDELFLQMQTANAGSLGLNELMLQQHGDNFPLDPSLWGKSLGIWARQKLTDLFVGTQTSSPASYTPVPLGWTSPFLPSATRPGDNGSGNSPYIWNSQNENPLRVFPQNNPLMGNFPISGNVVVNLVVSGDIGVKPDEMFSPVLSAAVDDSASRAIENAIRGFFPATGGSVIGGRPQ